MIISADSGHSYHKLYDGSRRTISPSVVLNWSRPGPIAREIHVDGKRYLVGESARTAVTSVIATPHLERGFHGSAEQCVQHCYAFNSLGIEGDHECFVQSVPYSDSRNQALIERLKSKREFEWASVEDSGAQRKHHVRFENVEIVPQGIGAMQAYCAKNEQDKPQSMMVVDIGSCTTDMVVIQRNLETGQPDYCHDACRSLEQVNATTFMRQWTDILRSEVRGLPLDKVFDFYRMMNMPCREREGAANAFGLRVDDEKVDCADAFYRTRDSFSATLVHALRSATGELWNEIDRIILTGGAELLVSDAHFDARLRRSNIWSNVEGQHAMVAADYEEVSVEGAA